MVNKKMIDEAADRIAAVVSPTPLQFCHRLSERYQADIYLKREDITKVRSFKIRGAYNKIASLSALERARGVVCASAGNHAQGVAYSCARLKIKGVIFMPLVTPNQKVDKVKAFGGRNVEIKLVGATFDEANSAAQAYCKKTNAVLIPPFDDELVIAGQGTVAAECVAQLSAHDVKPEIVVACVGGGGLISGIATYLHESIPTCKVYGSEPEGADCMQQALRVGHPVTLERIDTFVDGAAVRTAGKITFEIVRDKVASIAVVPVGLVCTTMIELYQNEGIIAEPAGALAVAALEMLQGQIKNKKVVCIVSGGNNDLLRYPDILEKSLVYRGLKHYFIIEFAQKPGQLRNFLNNALGPNDDIVLFEYFKKTNKEKGPALVGIELKKKEDLQTLIHKMDKLGMTYRKITADDLAFNLLI
jgi:threonine dehydratase